MVHTLTNILNHNGLPNGAHTYKYPNHNGLLNGAHTYKYPNHNGLPNVAHIYKCLGCSTLLNDVLTMFKLL